MKSDIGFVFIYVAAFGFSDYLITNANIEGLYLIFYYIFILIIGCVFIWLHHREENNTRRLN
tara:strand:+ start:236 stop:421 length:186 start_codon:yes stop_codon:yes gene_type:complete